MKQKGAEGLVAEEFTGMVNGLDRLARPQSGWDPYEVWRTRVKGASTVTQERELNPLRHRGGARGESMMGRRRNEA
jgi:hypothetical protein